MNKVVLDASAILALLNDEPGAEKITPELLSRATTSAVNLAEVQTILVREGGDPDESWALARRSNFRSRAVYRGARQDRGHPDPEDTPSRPLLRRQSLFSIGHRSGRARLHNRPALEKTQAGGADSRPPVALST